MNKLTHKEWWSHYERLLQIKGEMYDRLKTECNEIDSVYLYFGISQAHNNRLQKEIPYNECQKYVGFFVLVGGTPPSQAEVPFLDFPGDLSVEKYLTGFANGTTPIPSMDEFPWLKPEYDEVVARQKQRATEKATVGQPRNRHFV